ncbi:MAG: sensor histidine kinase [Gaiellaceae bacterium]
MRERLQRRGSGRIRPVLIDVALFLLVLAATTAWADRDTRLVYAIPLGLAQALPLLVRRRYPLTVFAVVVVAALFFELRYESLPPFASALAMYTVASHVVDRRSSLHAGLLGLIVLSTSPLFLQEQSDEQIGHLVIVHLIGFTVAWIVGDNVRAHRAYLSELEERAERLEREKGEHARHAAAEEQARIARELHDVIAHSVSVMVVQAAAARDVFEQKPERALEALSSIEESGRSALTELRRLLGIVRAEESEEREPQPGMTELGALIDKVRATGLEVELELDTSLGELPAGVELSVYRIVQEALTNTLKHAQASRARVEIARGRGCHGRELTIEVSDNGSGPGERAEDGHGLIGMRERVALLGGELEAGPRAGGGFAVKVRLPLGRKEPS